MKRLIFVAIFSSLLSLSAAYGQQNTFAIQYDISFGSNDLGDYIGATSFRGASLDYRHALNANVGVGITTAWNVFYENRDYASYSYDNNTLSGVQYRYQNQIPILVAASYAFQSDKPVVPYVDFGIGTLYTERSTEMGLYYVEENQWHFAIKPEIGITYKINPGSALKLALRYYNGFEAGDLASQNYFSISTGFVFGK